MAAKQQVRGNRDDYVSCYVCHRAVLYAKSRMFWLGGGVVRTCSAGLADHEAPANAARIEDIQPMA